MNGEAEDRGQPQPHSSRGRDTVENEGMGGRPKVRLWVQQQTREEAASADRGRGSGLGEETAGIETSHKRFGDQERRAA